MRVDEISLTLPADDAFRRVAHLVLGGLAVRLDLTYESLEDLELALDTLLERSPQDDDVTVRVRVEGDELRTTVSPVPAGRPARARPGSRRGARHPPRSSGRAATASRSTTGDAHVC